MKFFLLGFLLIRYLQGFQATKYSFPAGFLFGTATASYQTEGAWNESGKGVSIWDTLTHDFPELILDGSNGDVACDSYHKYKEDVALMKNLGVDFYRFSISWTRIFPNGHPYNLNEEGIKYYNNLLDELISNDIIPMVTIFHWDLPQALQDLGGWTNPWVITYFTEYARVLFENFASKVKYWITFNEPFQICQAAYGQRRFAPVLGMSGIADYLCGHNLLKAHASAYHLFNDSYRSINNGTIGITVNGQWYEPNTTNDQDAAERGLQFYIGWFLNPIFSDKGDYPEVMKTFVAGKSEEQGLRSSRLPTFTEEEIEYIKRTSDFLGLNHYTSYMAAEGWTNNLTVSFYNDWAVNLWQEGCWGESASEWLKVVPCGFRKLLKWLKNTYNDPVIHVTENGYSTWPDVQTDDPERISYYGQYLEALLESIYEDEVNIVSYAAWSLLDNFEWVNGYEHRFGIYAVDFSDPDRPRTKKSSAEFYKNIIGNRTVVEYERVFDVDLVC